MTEEASEPKLCQTREVFRSRPISPGEQPVAFLNGHIVDAVGAKEMTGVIVPFILETHSNAVVGVRPHFFDQPIIEFLGPFTLQKLENLVAALDEFAAVSPAAVFCIGHGNGLWITAIPGIFSHPSFLDRGFKSEWRKRRLAGHGCVLNGLFCCNQGFSALMRTVSLALYLAIFLFSFTASSSVRVQAKP